MYILEGNVGAGKSTFLRLINEYIKNVSITLEPIHKWHSQIYGQSLLTNFYQDPHRWAYTFENLTLISRVQNHLIEQEKASHTHIIERSIYSGSAVFARNSFESQFLTDTEWAVYQQWYNSLTQDKCRPPYGIIYLRVSPEVAAKRIKKRNRLSEKQLTLAYIRQIHQRHEDLFIDKKNIDPAIENCPVLTINCNDDFQKNKGLMNKHIEKIHAFLEATNNQSISISNNTTCF